MRISKKKQYLDLCVFSMISPKLPKMNPAPTFDFIQELRTFGSELEVLAPKSLRDKFAEEAANLSALYK